MVVDSVMALDYRFSGSGRGGGVLEWFHCMGASVSSYLTRVAGFLGSVDFTVRFYIPDFVCVCVW